MRKTIPAPMIVLTALAVGLVTVGSLAQEVKPMSNLEILRNAAVFGMCQEPASPEDVEALAGMGVDVVVRGISCAWHRNPEQTREAMAARRELAELARQHGIVFCTMITSSAIFPDRVPSPEFELFAAKDAHGNLIPAGSWNQGCLNVPGYRQLVKDIARAAIDGGADGLHYDEAYSRWFWMRPIPCFCDDCGRELRAFLKEHVPADELRDRYGIADVERFQYRDYLAEKGWQEEPWQSPLHQLWWRMQLEATYRYEKEIVDDAKRYGREKYGREIVVNSNPYQVAALSPIMTLESAVYDFINIGTGWSLDFRDHGWRGAALLPPEQSFVPQYKMARAHAGGKPVDMFLDIQEVPDFIAELPAEQVDHVMQWLFAEAYASGCFFAAHHRFSNYNGPIASQQRYGRFYKRYRRYFVGSEQVASIGVLYSYPAQVWDMLPLHWNRASEEPAHSRQYWGVCQALQDANLQYETLFLGDGQLFPFAPPAEVLARYPVLIAPECYALTDAALESLRAYLAGGGRLLITGRCGNFDENLEPRVTLPFPPLPSPSLPFAKEGEADRVLRVEGDFEAFLNKRELSPRVNLIRALVEMCELTPEVMVADPEAPLQAHVRWSVDGNALVLHLINRDFQRKRGFTPSSSTTVEIELPEGFSAEAAEPQLLGPDYHNGEPTPLPKRIITPQRIAVTVPEVTVFASVVVERKK